MLELLDQWTAEPGGARSCVLPKIGRLTEWRNGSDVERLVETSFETFYGSWTGLGLRFASELLTADELAVTSGLDHCAIVVLMACETGPFFCPNFVHEPVGLVEALRLAGARTIVATAWPVREVSTLLFSALLYAELLVGRQHVDVGHAVRTAASGLRDITREAAVARLEEFAEGFTGADAFRLAALAHQIGRGPQHPFSDPVHWGAFYAVGAPIVTRSNSSERTSGKETL